MKQQLLIGLMCWALAFPMTAQNGIDMTIHPSVELLGLAYFIGYEGVDIETKTMVVDGREIPKKEFHTFGYQVYQEYRTYLASPHLAEAFQIADHLWLDYLLGLLLRVDPVPNATLPDDLDPVHYRSFSKTKDPVEARELARRFLVAFNAFFREIAFDQFLEKYHPHYTQALQEVSTHLPRGAVTNWMESYFKESFAGYKLVPSLTLPKGMGFGLNNGQDTIYNVFGALDEQVIDDTDHLITGFQNSQKLRELTIHEFGHSFVNPVVYALPDSLFKQSASLFEPIRTTINEQGYDTWEACVIEHFVRAVELVLSEHYDTPEAYQNLRKAYIQDRQFIYIPHLRPALHRVLRGERSFAEAVPLAMRELVKLSKSGDE